MKLDQEDIDAITEAVIQRAKKEIRYEFWGLMLFLVILWAIQHWWV
jgi:hypothetical protein